MQVEVKLFAVLRERAGRGSIELELPSGSTVADALAAVGAEPGMSELIERMPVCGSRSTASTRTRAHRSPRATSWP